MSPIASLRASRGLAIPRELERAMHGWVADWIDLWKVPELRGALRLEFNRRMTRSLGRCRPDRAEIRLAHWVLDAPRPILRSST